ncbi:hypothetical protein D1007_36012 [Hordeum vulgare]|nr:hypothetical protein D1007_36012 [Hordeum vulgare]
MEEKRNEEIQKFRTNQKQKEKYKAAKRKLPELLAEELTNSDSEDEILADDDIIARVEAVKRHRADPLIHYEGDTDVEELYEPGEEEGRMKHERRSQDRRASRGGQERRKHCRRK